MATTIYDLKDLGQIFEVPKPFEMDLPWEDYNFSERFLKVVNDWEIPTEKEIEFLNSYLKPQSEILELASGGGRHSIGLARGGHRLTAVEIGRYPVERARKTAGRENLDIDFITGDIRKLDYRNRFDMAFLICGQLGHFSPEDAGIIFQNGAKSLKDGGYFIVHLMTFNSDDRSSYVQWYREKEPFYFEHPSVVHREQFFDKDREVKIIRDFAIDVVTRENRLFGISEKFYTEPEIRSFADQSGLKLVETYGNYEKKPVSANSSSIIYLFCKK